MISMLAHFDVPGKHKTIGVLFRGGSINPFTFPPVAAMSGWKHKPDSDLNVQVEGKTWTSEVLHLCQIVGHNLPADSYDQGVPGRFYACHAEKQLTAYFVSKHIFLDHEVDVDDLGMSSLSLDESPTCSRHKDTLTKLQRIQPPQRLQNATILASRAVCDDCNGFIRRVNMAFTLNIQLRGAIQCA
ncbi:hypothetical protein S40293_04040 [Stachybotrys chartarum IBT 40293]|nr:hypothetical protein S40293_04040 [Stachybotrys chartarum IBT 40293]